MAKTSPITKYKNKLVTSIINSPELVELLDSSYVNNGKFVEESGDLVYKQVFPYYYIPESEPSQKKEAKSFLIMKALHFFIS